MAGEQVYSSPIGAMPKTGAPMGSLLNGALQGASGMSGIPSLTLNGGAAAPSGAVTGDIKNSVYNSSGGGFGLWLVLGGVAWLIYKKVGKR